MTAKFIDHKIIVYLIASIIPLMSISIFLADLTLSILSIIFLIYLLRNNHLIFYKNIFFLISMIFYITCITSSFLSEDIFYSLRSSVPLIRIIIFIFLIGYLIENNIYFLDIVYNFIKFTVLIVTIYGLVSYIDIYYLLDSSNILNSQNIRLKLPMSDEEKIGSYLVRLFGLLLALHIISKKNKKFENFVLFLLALLTSVVILLSGERTSLFFLILFISICVILLNINLKIKLSYILSIVFFSIILLGINGNLSKRIIFDQNNQLNLASENIIIFTPQHTAHYKTALNLFKDKPLIGKGPKMFRKLCYYGKYNENVVSEENTYNGCTSHPHNTYIQLLAETGIIGTLLFSLGFFHITFNLLKHFFYVIFKKGKKLTNYQIIINATTLIVFWPFSPSGNFFNNWILIMYALPLSFYVNEYFRYKNYEKS